MYVIPYVVWSFLLVLNTTPLSKDAYMKKKISDHNPNNYLPIFPFLTFPLDSHT